VDPRFAEVVTSEAQFRSVIGHPSELVLRKHVRSLEQHGRAFIAKCPFLVLASADAAGNMDVSPKGDAPGFVRVLDDSTLAIPDRPGNRTAATFSNLRRTPMSACSS
jgi:predicted pyridoxine 5'-phosphate oxidase superfamily flavin-nucleotide-binding protein